jgi:lipid II isoglutaminyl synthase (glutamine-hydrolysing)
MFWLILLYSYFAKFSVCFLKLFKLGNGTAITGLIVEKYYPSAISRLAKGINKIILVTGTNGKTTTRSLLVKIFDDNSVPVCTNVGGANIMRGIASSLLANWNWKGQPKIKTLILEVEEATMPILTRYINPTQIIITNIFRDQLDAYGEIDQTLDYFRKSIIQTTSDIIINSDDCKLLEILRGISNRNITGFGIEDKKIKMLDFEKSSCTIKVNFDQQILATSVISKNLIAHIETDWLEQKKIRNNFEIQTGLLGTYNIYNVLAALACTFPIFNNEAIESITNAQPVFGRGEKIIYRNKEIWLFLVKNPAGMNQVCELVSQNFAGENINIGILINDKIADGKDVSWLWDCEIEELVAINPKFKYYTGGMRSLDMLLRLEHAGAKVDLSNSYDSLENILDKKLGCFNAEKEKHIILATYTAMLKIRKLIGERTKLSNMGDKGN